MSDSDGPTEPAFDEPSYRKSSFSGSGNCVEVMQTPEAGAIQVRDSKDRLRYTLTFSRREWQSFICRVKSGEFDST